MKTAVCIMDKKTRMSFDAAFYATPEHMLAQVRELKIGLVFVHQVVGSTLFILFETVPSTDALRSVFEQILRKLEEHFETVHAYKLDKLPT